MRFNLLYFSKQVPANCLTEKEQVTLYTILEEMASDIQNGQFHPAIIAEKSFPVYLV